MCDAALKPGTQDIAQDIVVDEVFPVRRRRFGKG